MPERAANEGAGAAPIIGANSDRFGLILADFSADFGRLLQRLVYVGKLDMREGGAFLI